MFDPAEALQDRHFSDLQTALEGVQHYTRYGGGPPMSVEDLLNLAIQRDWASYDLETGSFTFAATFEKAQPQNPKRLILPLRESCRVSFVLTSLAGDCDPLGPTFRGFDTFISSEGQALLKTIVIVWPTDKRGRLNKDTFKTDWQIKTLVLHPGLFSNLLELHREWDVGQTDVKIHCTALHDTGNPQWPVWRFAPCRESVFRVIAEKRSEEESAETLYQELMEAVRQAGAPETTTVPFTPLMKRNLPNANGDVFIGVDWAKPGSESQTAVHVMKTKDLPPAIGKMLDDLLEEPVAPVARSRSPITTPHVSWGRRPVSTEEWKVRRKARWQRTLDSLREHFPRWDWHPEDDSGYLCFQGVQGDLILEAEANQNMLWSFSLYMGPPTLTRFDRRAFKASACGDIPKILNEFLEAAQALCGEMSR